MAREAVPACSAWVCGLARAMCPSSVSPPGVDRSSSNGRCVTEAAGSAPERSVAKLYVSMKSSSSPRSVTRKDAGTYMPYSSGAGITNQRIRYTRMPGKAALRMEMAT